jgi:hypothetical protein
VGCPAYVWGYVWDILYCSTNCRSFCFLRFLAARSGLRKWLQRQARAVSALTLIGTSKTHETMTRQGWYFLLVLIVALAADVEGFHVHARALAPGHGGRQITLHAMHRCSKTVFQGHRPGRRAGLRHVMQLSDAVETSSMALPEGLYKLNADMRVAVQMEDFKKAAELRDSIKAETAREPVARLLAKLKEAVDEQV